MRLPEKIRTSPFCDRYLHNRAFRGIVGVWGGTAANFAFAVYRLVLWLFYASSWFVATAVYYFFIGCLRAALGFAYRKRALRGGFAYECRLYRRTARLLFLLNIPMGGMILLLIRTTPTVTYPGFTIYASATFTFYMMTLSVINLVKFRKVGSPILSAAKALNFVAALMSLLGLQNALIVTFSGDGTYRTAMNTLTGSAVYAAVIAVALFMLCRTPKERKETPQVNKSESKYFNTARRMDEALMTLLEKKDFEYITVKEVCSAAGVNRSTFYLHYENTSDLLAEAVADMQKTFLSYFAGKNEDFFQKLGHCEKEELRLITPEYLIPYLTFIRDHKRLYAAAMRTPSNFRSEDSYRAMFRHVFDPILARFSVPTEEREYMMSFYLQGIAAVVARWLAADCRDPMERVTAVILHCIPSLPETKRD